MSPDENDEMTAAAIARLAGVGRAAVSNWRRRYPKFPKPVGGSAASPRFSRDDVMTWLVSTGKAGQLATAGRTETGTQALGDFSEPERSVAKLTSGEFLAEVMVSLLPRTTVDARPVDADDDVGDVPVVLDPACADGMVLVAAADRFGDEIRLAGQEIREATADQAASNLRVNTNYVRYEVHVADSLRDNRLDRYLGVAAAVVCEPPLDQPRWPSTELAADPRWEFGVPEPRDGELAWVQHCYAHLRPRGVAVVAVSPRTCVQPSGQHVRAALVSSGALRDVIALPRRMGSQPDTDVYLWVLRRPHGAVHRVGGVRLVNLAGLNDTADVPHEYGAWQQLFHDVKPAICRIVPRAELLDNDADLLPSRYVTARADMTADDLVGITDRLRSLYARAGQCLPRLGASESSGPHSFVTLRELEGEGALTVRSRDTTPRQGDLLLRTLGRAPAVATGTAADEVGVAQVVEVDASRLDTHFVATFLRADAAALPVANTLGALSRDDLRRCRIPRMSLAEQRRYGDVFRRLREVEGMLTTLAKVSRNVIDQAVEGLTTGVLTPDAPTWKSIDAIEGETRKL